MTDALLPAAPQPLEKENDGYFRKGCNPLAQTGRSKLQNQRAALNQQILKAVRMRTGCLNAACLEFVPSDVRMCLEFLPSGGFVVSLAQEILSWNITVKMAIYMKMKLQILWI
uniref:Uncharacterized protein n=1 Tax=Pan troglodytes TaxID=9598 RepID=A0A2I3S4T0_PANTR